MLKQNSYSVTDKLALIANVKHGGPHASVFTDNGLPELTIHGWLRDERKLHDFEDTVNSTDQMKRKQMARTAKEYDTYIVIYHHSFSLMKCVLLVGG